MDPRTNRPETRLAGRPEQAFVIEGNTQRLDGGAMFGNAPRAVWSRWIAPDERHRIPLACRAMLVREDSGRHILFEAGIGAFFPPAMKDRFGVVENEHVLLTSLAALGLTPEDIDVIALSHLHFDHAGGLLTAYREGEPLDLVFPHARYVVSRPAWERAKNPHPRDKASFIPELTALLENVLLNGRLELVDVLPTAGPLGQGASTTLGPHYHLHLSEGHTPGLMLAEVALPEGPMVYAGDLIPGAPWVHLPITMGYDRYPERLIDEKAQLLSDLVARGGRLFFTHDPTTPMGHVGFEAGRYSLAAQPIYSRAQ